MYITSALTEVTTDEITTSLPEEQKPLNFKDDRGSGILHISL